MKKPIIIRGVEAIKKNLNIQTYFIEYAFVAIILIAVAIGSGKGWIEWIGVAAVFLTFGHASIAERLREREALRHLKRSPIEVACYWKLPYYFYAKELLWLLYFVCIGAWSALAGVFVFLAYTPWRSYYRKWHPIREPGE
ncbi:MAG: hypothetical protein WCG20_03635 [bacterium]